MNANVIKKVGKLVFTTTVTTFTSCMVRDVYNKYAHDIVIESGIKNKINRLNPFKKK